MGRTSPTCDIGTVGHGHQLPEGDVQPSDKQRSHCLNLDPGLRAMKYVTSILMAVSASRSGGQSGVCLQLSCGWALCYILIGDKSKQAITRRHGVTQAAIICFRTIPNPQSIVPPCARAPLGFAISSINYGNCQRQDPALTYANCICSKVSSSVSWCIVTAINDQNNIYTCSDPEITSAYSVFSNFCSVNGIAALLQVQRRQEQSVGYISVHTVGDELWLIYTM